MHLPQRGALLSNSTDRFTVRLTRLGVLALVLVIVASPALIASATTLQVDSGNSGCNDTVGLPFCTIQAAIDAAIPQDTVAISAQTYRESITIDRDLQLQGAVEYNLVRNGMLEDDRNGDRLPDDWKALNTRLGDRLYCGRRSGHLGGCAARVAGNDTSKEVFQVITRSGLANDPYELVVYAATKNASAVSLAIGVRFAVDDVSLVPG